MTATDLTWWLQNLDADKEIFPHQFDIFSDKILLVKLSDQEIRHASFLDQRALTPQTQGAWLPWNDITQSIPDRPYAAPHFIFHMGHCGSTLLSRLLEQLSPMRALREPLVLRSLAEEQAHQSTGLSFWNKQDFLNRFDQLLYLLSRPPTPCIIKATSMCTDLMKVALTRATETKVAFVFIPPETYISALLGGSNALTDLRGFARIRATRLQQMLKTPISLASLSLGQLAAMSWLCETASACQALDNAPKKGAIKTINFDNFLIAPQQQLTSLSQHFNIQINEETISAVLASDVMRTYSKAPEHPYDTDLRRKILQDSMINYASEINNGIVWLKEMSSQHVLAAKAFKEFG